MVGALGLYLRTEQIDEYFLDRYKRRTSNLYKAMNHSGSMDTPRPGFILLQSL